MNLHRYWKKYRLALKKETVEVEKWLLKHPTLGLFLGVCLLALTGAMIWQMVTYVPSPPSPTMTIFGFFDRLQIIELPGLSWILLFLFLWLTKW